MLQVISKVVSCLSSTELQIEVSGLNTLYEQLKFWSGAVSVDGTDYPDVETALKSSQISVNNINTVVLKQSVKVKNTVSFDTEIDTKKQYQITVKKYMTQPSTSTFDFMKKWNNDIPMPLMTMCGSIEKETPGMVYMNLHGDIVGTIQHYCMKCGQPITNPVSQYFGMGPVCGNHNYINPFKNDEELMMAVDRYRKEYLSNIKWSGWIIKSAITEKEVISDGSND